MGEDEPYPQNEQEAGIHQGSVNRLALFDQSIANRVGREMAWLCYQWLQRSKQSWNDNSNSPIG